MRDPAMVNGPMIPATTGTSSPNSFFKIRTALSSSGIKPRERKSLGNSGVSSSL